jgi:hypothetical protein
MPTPEPPGTLLICCGAIAREVVALVRDNDWHHMRVECLPAHLHNTPEAIPEAVRVKIRAARRRGDDEILVLYGDCGTGGLLDKVLREEGVERIFGNHCYEAFAGPEELAEVMAAEPGTFFVTDFLARHFERLVIKGLGLDRYPKLRDSYFGRYRKLLYLAQSRDSDLEARARKAARTLGLAFEMRHTGFGGYERFLADRAAHPGRSAADKPADRGSSP